MGKKRLETLEKLKNKRNENPSAKNLDSRDELLSVSIIMLYFFLSTLQTLLPKGEKEDQGKEAEVEREEEREENVSICQPIIIICLFPGWQGYSCILPSSLFSPLLLSVIFLF